MSSNTRTRDASITRPIRVALIAGAAWAGLMADPGYADPPGGKVTICHIPKGNPGNAHTITVSVHALPAHVPRHGGDFLGACANGGISGNGGNGGNGFPPVPGNDLATALNEEARIKDKVELDPFGLRALERLGIYVRPLRADELVAAAKGPHVFIDVPSQAGGPREEPRIAINRLRRASVLAVVQRSETVFPEDPSEREHIRNTLEAAWERYSASADAPDPVDFRADVESNPDEQECLVYVNGLRDLFSEMWIMGLNSAELRRSKDIVLGPVTPQNMGQDQLEQTIEIGSVT